MSVETAAPEGTAATTEPPRSNWIDSTVAPYGDLLGAERALVGCLLRMDAEHARPNVAQVAPDDLGDPALAEALVAVTELVGADVTPEPCAVFAVLRTRMRARAAATAETHTQRVLAAKTDAGGRADEADHCARRDADEARLVHAVALLLADLSACTAVPASAMFYVGGVLEEAARRRAREAGQRVAQAAELVPIEQLPELVARELTAVLVVADRARQAAA